MAGEETLPNLADLEIKELIGEGGMGSVYRGYQPVLDREVAVKFLNSKRTSKPKEVTERFRREARILASLAHPNIVSCYHAGVANQEGKIYLVMELVKGPDFAAFLKENAPLNINLALKITRDIADALRYAAEHNVIHRDIKPANILLQTKDASTSTEGRVSSELGYTPKLADLGLAKYQVMKGGQTEVTQMGAIMGSPVYMAPEQIEDPDNVDFRADVYALGCVLFQSLTGQKPFQQTTIIDIINKKLSADAPDPRAYRSDLPEPVAQLVQKMMQRKLQDRGATYTELIAEFDRLLSDKPAEKLAPAVAQKKSGASVWIAALVVVILISGGLIAYSLSSNQQKPESTPLAATAEVKPIASPLPIQTSTPKPTPEPSPTPLPVRATINDVLWDEDGTALFNPDWATRLEGWNAPTAGSYGPPDGDDAEGIIGYGENGSLSYPITGKTPCLIIGAIGSITATDFGMFVESESGIRYRLLFQLLDESILVRMENVEKNGTVTSLGNAFTMQMSDIQGFKVGIWESHIEFFVVGGEQIKLMELDSAPTAFGIFQKGMAIKAIDFSIHRPVWLR